MIELALDTTNYDSITDIELEGTEYKYRLYWHQLYNRWHLDLETITGESLVTGKKLTIGVPIFRYRKLPGDFFVISNQPTNDTPAKVDDLGDRIRMFYLTSDELQKAVRLRESYSLSDFMHHIIENT